MVNWKQAIKDKTDQIPPCLKLPFLVDTEGGGSMMNGPEEQLVEGYRGICLSLSKTRAHKRKEQKEEEEEAEEGGEGRGGKGEGKYLAFCWENSHEHGSPAPTCQSISLGLTGLETG